MNTIPAVSYATKFLSNRHYLNEVPVENKRCSRYYQRFSLHQQYASLLIRNGNCITLLSQPIAITVDSFWNILHFEELVKYVFWTFSESFRLLITKGIQSLSKEDIIRCKELLQGYSVAYSDMVAANADEEVLWCLQKNSHLKKDSRYAQMYQLDTENRTAILQKLEEATQSIQQINHSFQTQPKVPVDAIAKLISGETISPVTFINLLKPLQKDSRTTLQFIRDSLVAADFTFNLFSPISSVANGKNPYGLNGQIAAMIDFFFQHHYFIKDIDERQIFIAYCQFSGNRIGKFGTFYAQFRSDATYIKYFKKLKDLKISKLE